RYMVHQQGIQGAIEHYTHPERVAWQSMCETDEGVLKGEQWCRRCIWRNLSPQWKQTFKKVEKISSGDFVSLWTGRVNHLANRFTVRRGTRSPNPPATSPNPTSPHPTSPHPKSHVSRRDDALTLPHRANGRLSQRAR